MIDIGAIRTAIVEALDKYTQHKTILANQTAHIPAHPYISFTITTPIIANNGSYGRYDDGINRKVVKQIWSFTAQSKTHDEAFELAMKAHNYFDIAGREELKEHGIIIETVGNITNRDTLLTNFYEYRHGFDVTFRVMDAISQSELNEGEIISANVQCKDLKERE